MDHPPEQALDVARAVDHVDDLDHPVKKPVDNDIIPNRKAPQAFAQVRALATDAWVPGEERASLSQCPDESPRRAPIVPRDVVADIPQVLPRLRPDPELHSSR